MKKIYPVILTPDDGGYLVFVPDLNINTEGESLTDAIDMARDAIGMWGIAEEDMGRPIPEPSVLNPDHKPGDIATLVDIDFAAYRKANDTRTVRRNVSLPSWLNELANEHNVNCSAVLQDALKAHLHIQDR